MVRLRRSTGDPGCLVRQPIELLVGRPEDYVVSGSPVMKVLSGNSDLIPKTLFTKLWKKMMHSSADTKGPSVADESLSHSHLPGRR